MRVGSPHLPPLPSPFGAFLTAALEGVLLFLMIAVLFSLGSSPRPSPVMAGESDLGTEMSYAREWSTWVSIRR